MEREDNRICAKCEYPLKGLPRQGKCPECGSGFNTASGMGVAYPLTGRQRGNKIAEKVTTLMLVMGLFITLGCMGAFAAITTPGKNFWWLAGSIAALFTLTLIGRVMDYYKRDV